MGMKTLVDMVGSCKHVPHFTIPPFILGKVRQKFEWKSQIFFISKYFVEQFMPKSTL